MRRRDVLAGFCTAAIASPRKLLAQPPPGRTQKIGWLVPGTESSQANLEEYRNGMRDLGYIEGSTVETLYVYAGGKPERLPERADKLVAERVDLIVTVGTPGCLAAKQATTTIPIVFASSSDPVSTKVVASLAKPGGNITGLSLMATDISAKRIELLRALLPELRRFAVLWDSSNPGMALRASEAELAAKQVGAEFFDAGAHDLDSLDASFVALSDRRPLALLVTVETFTNYHRNRIIEFATRARIPVVFEERSFVAAGGLMSYGPRGSAMFRRAAVYVDKILNGANPAELPVEQPTRFELVINLKTATALGLTVPPSLLARADEVIE
jgi:putative ABC transport system substrate-binding protein